MFPSLIPAADDPRRSTVAQKNTAPAATIWGYEQVLNAWPPKYMRARAGLEFHTAQEAADLLGSSEVADVNARRRAARVAARLVFSSASDKDEQSDSQQTSDDGITATGAGGEPSAEGSQNFPASSRSLERRWSVSMPEAELGRILARMQPDNLRAFNNKPNGGGINNHEFAPGSSSSTCILRNKPVGGLSPKGYEGSSNPLPSGLLVKQSRLPGLPRTIQAQHDTSIGISHPDEPSMCLGVLPPTRGGDSADVYPHMQTLDPQSASMPVIQGGPATAADAAGCPPQRHVAGGSHSPTSIQPAFCGGSHDGVDRVQQELLRLRTAADGADTTREELYQAHCAQRLAKAGVITPLEFNHNVDLARVSTQATQQGCSSRHFLGAAGDASSQGSTTQCARYMDTAARPVMAVVNEEERVYLESRCIYGLHGAGGLMARAVPSKFTGLGVKELPRNKPHGPSAKEPPRARHQLPKVTFNVGD